MKINTLTILYGRILELPENFYGFTQSELSWDAAQYHRFLRNPEACSPEDMKVILKIAGHLADDLKALVLREKKRLAKP